jgi:hypothetical protein
MASERQIAANRRNAKKSCGPKTLTGKKRASCNSFRHGLSSAMTWNGEAGARIRELTELFSGNADDPLILERASLLAQSKLQLDRLSLAKMEMIKRVFAQGSVDKPPMIFDEIIEVDGRVIVTEKRGMKAPKSLRIYPRLPADETRRTTSAVRRALPTLMNFDRYERRAVSLFQRAFRDFIRLCPLPPPDKSEPQSEEKLSRKAWASRGKKPAR